MEKQHNLFSLLIAFIYSVADFVQTPTEEETELTEQFNID